MRLRIVALVVILLVGSASVADADVCTNLAFAYAQAAESMAAKDLVALRQCVNAQITKNEQARKQGAHDRKTAPTFKKKRHAIIAGTVEAA